MLQPLATRALQNDAQRDEGVADGVILEPIFRRKRRREAQEINIVGMQSLLLVFMQRFPQVSEETDSAE